VVVGPKTTLLEYDESIMVLELSTGKPKTTDKLIQTVYLKVSENRVSDIIDVETSDMCPVEIKLSMLASFIGSDPHEWFKVENYVKTCADHVRSLLKAATLKYSIRDWYSKAAELIRDTILGKAVPSEGGTTQRPGLKFERNSLHVYEVEVLQVVIKDPATAQKLNKDQAEALQQELTVAAEERALGHAIKTEDTKRKKLRLLADTETIITELALAQVQRSEELVARQEKSKQALENLERETAALQRDENAIVLEVELEGKRLKEEQRLALAKAEIEVRKDLLKAESEAFSEHMKAFTPGLQESLKMLGDKLVVRELAQHLSPLAALRNTSIVSVAHNMLKGTPLAGMLSGLSGDAPDGGVEAKDKRS